MSLLRTKEQLSDDSNEIKVIKIYLSRILLKSLLFGQQKIKKWQKKNVSLRPLKGIELGLPRPEAKTIAAL